MNPRMSILQIAMSDRRHSVTHTCPAIIAAFLMLLAWLPLRAQNIVVDSLLPRAIQGDDEAFGYAIGRTNIPDKDEKTLVESTLSDLDATVAALSAEER